MCGHVGILSSDMLNRHKDCLKLLLYFDTLRGEDATGVAAIRNNFDIQTFKSTVPGYDYVNDPRFSGLLRLSDKAWIGHNRFATMGKKNRANAHPFEVVDADMTVLVGAHNGTLKNKTSIPNEKDFGTDSEALLNLIYKEGPKDAIAQAEGAWALVWFNALENTLCFLRNKERTFFFVYEKGKKTVIWASESWMLRTACSKTGIEIEDDTVYTTVENRLYTWDMPTKTTDTLAYRTEEGLEGKPETFFRSRNYYGDGWEQGWKNETKKAVEETKKEEDKKTNVILLPHQAKGSSSGTTQEKIGLRFQQNKENKSTSRSTLTSTTKSTISPGAMMVKGFKGALIAKPEAQLILDSGCAWCEEETITFEDAFGWMSPNHVVCNKCLTDRHPQPAYMTAKRKVN